MIKNVNNLHQKYGKCLTLQQVTYVARLCTKVLQTLRKKPSSKLSKKTSLKYTETIRILHYLDNCLNQKHKKLVYCAIVISFIH